MELRILPGNIANMIAAGEVVQRPASVVKELMENAVDAGATEVTVIVTDAGRTLIQVIDDGSGMSPDDAVLCFERHATSKIATAEDLESIGTFGFRGEALASIAAVADVTLRTRREGDEVGVEVVFSGSEHVSTREVAAPKGSNFAVRNLFYNIPARRKFLKSDKVELRHILEEFTRVALTRPETAFTLTHNGKDIYVLKPAKSLKFRVQDLLGSTVASDVVDIAAETSVVTLHGFVERPDTARKTPGNQFFFVNGRYFRSPYLHKAVMNAYADMAPEGVMPAYLIYLAVDPHTVDVNIHPTKTEVKFAEDSVIFQIIYAAVKEAIGRTGIAGSLEFDNPEVKALPIVGKRFEEYRPVRRPAAADFAAGYDPFEEEGKAAPDRSPVDTGRYVSRSDNYGRLFEESTLPATQVLTVQGKYILSPSQTGILMVHVRRARERILYDRFLKLLQQEAHVSQTSLFPEQVQVGAENRTVFDEHQALLSSLGFDIAPFGTDTIVVNAVPEGFSAEGGKVRTMVQDLLLILSDDHAALPEMLTASMAEKFAVLGASGAADITSPVEARRLLDALLGSGNPEYTSGGKKILSVLTADEIAKRF